MTKIEELKAAYEAATPGEWKACRGHEDFDGPMFDIDEWEQAEHAARPFVYICASAQRVTNNHDLFQFDEANARLITLMHNNLPALLEAVEALEAVKARASGEFDNPSLLKYGELGATSDDVVRIAKSALEKLK